MLTIKEIIKDNEVRYLRYRQGIFYYWLDTKDGPYMFPVPLEDIGDATLEGVDKAIYYMRYIRKALEDNTFISMSEYK